MCTFKLEKVLNNYLYLHYLEVKGILLYEGFPRPILQKHPELSEGCFDGKIGREIVPRDEM